MAKGFLIAQVTVTNPGAYSRYAKAAGDLLKHYGARGIVKPESVLIKEGNPKARTVIFEFETFDKAKEFWDSPEYVEAKALRADAADADFILIEGAD
ncbi:DUF1330 domain-containing protein [Pararhizobium sp. LjRoot238]|uniref:DUF1330 domain-containing protein n=1 Tax=Pararhizobium sp. LjRoot238 TaxID=3342293 RepID=UPI003ECEA982